MLNIPICHNNIKVSNLQLRIQKDFVEIHQEVYKWSKEIYQIFLEVFTELKEFAKEINKKYLGTITPLNKKLEKYLKMFGFIGPIKLENNYLFYYLEV